MPSSRLDRALALSLPRPEADALLEALCGELAWEQREIVLFGRRILQPRLIAWAGDLGYRYSGQTLDSRVFTPAVDASCPACASAGRALQPRAREPLSQRGRQHGLSRG